LVFPVLAACSRRCTTGWCGQGAPPAFAAFVVTLLGAVLLIIPGVLIAGCWQPGAGNHAERAAESDHRAVPRLQIRGIPLGPRLAEVGGRIVAAIGASAFGLVACHRLTLNLTISFFGLYYVSSSGRRVARCASLYPFSDANTEKLGSGSRM